MTNMKSTKRIPVSAELIQCNNSFKINIYYPLLSVRTNLNYTNNVNIAKQKTYKKQLIYTLNSSNSSLLYTLDKVSESLHNYLHIHLHLNSTYLYITMRNNYYTTDRVKKTDLNNSTC